MNLQNTINDIDNTLPQRQAIRQGGSLLMMSGLPGSGKSSLVRQLCDFVDCVVVSTDSVRTVLCQQPSYSLSEMAHVYEICYELIKRRLRHGQRVIFDASNYLSSRRRRLFALTQPFATPVAVCYVTAAESVIQSRLKLRSQNGRENGNMSDADYSVYRWMLDKHEPLRREHLVLDTTAAPCNILAHNLHQYWLKIEANASSDPHLQPFCRAN